MAKEDLNYDILTSLYHTHTRFTTNRFGKLKDLIGALNETSNTIFYTSSQKLNGRIIVSYDIEIFHKTVTIHVHGPLRSKTRSPLE